MTGRGLRIVGLADTDSYVKWAAALLGSLPEGSDAELLIIDTPLVVSPQQEEAALARSGLDRSRVRRVGFAQLADVLSAARPDAVLVAARGPLVRVLARAVAELEPRPVLVSGLPGISIPATTAALIHRTQCDLFVLHSTREVREFTHLARRRGLSQRFALSRLPFAVRGGATQPAPGDGTDLVFASQAKVPAERSDRMRVARLLLEAALADPSRRVVIKERGLAGEHQTHRQRHSIADLLAKIAPPPPNLVVSTAPMGKALDTAAGLVTVSSTAAIEAVARGIPVIALDSFGVSDELINQVFVGSGLLASEEAVVTRDFRHPTREWLRRNYFHDPAEDDWTERVAELVAQRRAGELPPKPARLRRGGRLRDAWERKLAFGSRDRSLLGLVVLIVGVPMRILVRPFARLRLRAAA
ncbi:MAG TPA: DUF6716 putative glycosyltransferase [Microbacterium sp.]|uniref:DUF6716 putative glycosyltransferase n=1 Tax=Microbacterium sp. TaxID=51671 RepID=UPI002C49DEAF|nr:DUF6716 putative glycosyltransferase [Microbacterium sp.]HWI31135.1 DUF6716 putative glycosyltransferase [Microbacterium sp.]